MANNEKTLTTKELANELGVAPMTILRAIKDLNIDVKVENGKSTRLNAPQATAIKIELQNHSKIARNGYDTLTISNDLEMMLLQKKLDAYKDKRIIELEKEKELATKRAEVAEKTNAILMHVNKTYTATEIAKEIGLRSANELNQILEDRGVQYKQNGTWIPHADYADCGYFEIKQEVLDSGKVIYHRKITQLGRKFILDLFGKESKKYFIA